MMKARIWSFFIQHCLPRLCPTSRTEQTFNKYSLNKQIKEWLNEMTLSLKYLW